MNYRDQQEFYSIRNDLLNAAKELENLSINVKKDFKNIGEYQVSKSLLTSANNYRRVVKMLNNISLPDIDE